MSLDFELLSAIVVLKIDFIWHRSETKIAPTSAFLPFLAPFSSRFIFPALYVHDLLWSFEGVDKCK